jgi:lipid A 3-O-deacylase
MFLTREIASVVLAASICVGSATAADLSTSATPAGPDYSETLPALTGFEFRSGGFVSMHGAEQGDPNFNAELIFPKIAHVQGWEDYLIPRAQLGGMANLSGGTSYIYGGPIWTIPYDRFFADIGLGGAVNDGQVGHYDDPDRNKMGCHVLYHAGADLGYKLTANWSVMITADHISNGSPTLSDCGKNEGVSVLGLRLGYSF